MMDLPFDGALALRRRSIWEAADAGLLLWRKDFRYLIPFFALPFWVCAFSLRLLPDSLRPLSWIALWYLRPLFDRLILQVVSTRFFRAAPENAVPSGRISRGLFGNLFRGLTGDLLWRRFSPWRPAMTPVRVLERLLPAQTRRRKQALSGGGIDFCVFISVWNLVLEGILLGGEVLFVLISAEIVQSGFINSLGDFAGKEIFLYTAWCINSIFTESIYVCMGFSLYLNSRIELEGWDLELLFRGLRRGRRRDPEHPPLSAGRRGTAAVILFLCLFTALSPATFAQESGAAGTYHAAGEVPLGTLEEILAAPEFGGEKESWGIRLRNRKESESPRFFKPAPWFSAIQKAFALILRGLLVLGLLCLGVFCVVYLYRMRKTGKDAGSLRKTTALPGKVVKDPEELLAEAHSLYGMGKIREAWAACYAASLAAWSRYWGLSFPPGATEYRCLALIRSQGPTVVRTSAGFPELIANWVSLAYGKHPPPEGAFEKAAAWVKDLCGEVPPAEVSPTEGPSHA
jgi:hypothetical protein